MLSRDPQVQTIFSGPSHRRTHEKVLKSPDENANHITLLVKMPPMVANPTGPRIKCPIPGTAFKVLNSLTRPPLQAWVCSRKLRLQLPGHIKLLPPAKLFHSLRSRPQLLFFLCVLAWLSPTHLSHLKCHALEEAFSNNPPHTP